MKVHVIKLQTIKNYIRNNAQSESGFNNWVSEIKGADWKKPEDIFSTFGSSDLLGRSSNRVVFDIGGNKYRMICHYMFGAEEIHLFINWIGTHAEYSKLCKQNKQYTESNF